MKKFNLLRPTVSRWVAVGILCTLFLLFGVGISTASASLKERNQEVDLDSVNPPSELNTLPDLEAPVEVDESSFVKITKFGNPLPEKYMKRVSSGQGLRDVIQIDSGGTSTSGKWHNGKDYPCPEKTPVYATKDGIVVEVWSSFYNGPYAYKGHPAYGGLVIIKHPDSTKTLYAHLSMTKVHEGDAVVMGQEIAWSGGTKGKRGSGTSTGPHLHYSIYLDMDDMYLD